MICLLATRRHLSAEHIRQAVPGYDSENDEAFQRMFERDKNELREIGIPIEVHKDPWEEDPGYRIVRQAYELPEITLEPDEAAVVGLAAQVWQRASLAEAASGALLKLRAAGIGAGPENQRGPDGGDEHSPVPQGIEPRLGTPEPAFGPLWEAAQGPPPGHLQLPAAVPVHHAPRLQLAPLRVAPPGRAVAEGDRAAVPDRLPQRAEGRLGRAQPGLDALRHRRVLVAAVRPRLRSASMPAARSFSSAPAAAPASSARRQTRAARPSTAASSGSSRSLGQLVGLLPDAVAGLVVERVVDAGLQRDARARGAPPCPARTSA